MLFLMLHPFQNRPRKSEKTIHTNLTLERTAKNSLLRAGLELAFRTSKLLPYLLNFRLSRDWWFQNAVETQRVPQDKLQIGPKIFLGLELKRLRTNICWFDKSIILCSYGCFLRRSPSKLNRVFF